jgi:hypothetical protein
VKGCLLSCFPLLIQAISAYRRGALRLQKQNFLIHVAAANGPELALECSKAGRDPVTHLDAVYVRRLLDVAQIFLWRASGGSGDLGMTR